MGYPQTVAMSTSSVTYQEPAFAVDMNNHIWLADLELVAPANTSGKIVLYERTATTTWSHGMAITNPNSSGVEQAPRPVFLPLGTGDSGTIGLIFQSYNCLYWAIVSATSSGTTVSTPIELSSYSTTPGTCNLPSSQEAVENSAFSVATDPSSGDQYLGFVINAATSGDTNIYTLTYQASMGLWIDGQALTMGITFPNHEAYVKSTFATSGSSTYAYMFINNGGELAFFLSDTLSGGATMYGSPVYNLLHPPITGTQNYDNPRIDAPEYIDSSYVPVWEQYTSSVDPMTGIEVQSLIYWSNVPN